MIDGFWNWYRTYNTGAAFSFLSDAGGWQKWFFVGAGLRRSAACWRSGWRARRARDWRTALPFALVIGGAIGNVIDRLLHGHVVDFIQWHWRDHYWPAFNVADSAIVAGAVGIALFGLLQRQAPRADRRGVKSRRMDILLANPRGFCAGVDRAIEIVKRALETLGAPIYVRHEVVHNRFVVDDLKHRGAVFVEELDEVPDGATVIFSAHGVSQAVRQRSRAPRAEGVRRDLPAGDQGAPGSRAPMPRRPRRGADRPRRPPGSRRHDGAVERAKPARGRIYLVEDIDDVATLEVDQPDNCAYTTQTTLSVDDTRGIIEALRARFPAIQGPKNDDICYATQNRQDAVRELAARVRPGAGRRLAQQLQFQPPARTGRARGRRGLPDRRRRARSTRRWVAGPPPHRRHRGRLGAGRAGARRDRRACASSARGGVRELDGEPEDMVFALPKELRLTAGRIDRPARI